MNLRTFLRKHGYNPRTQVSRQIPRVGLKWVGGFCLSIDKLGHAYPLSHFSVHQLLRDSWRKLSMKRIISFLPYCWPLFSVCNRCGNRLGSAWRWQMKTISKNIINSSNDMKTQTSKCHTFSVLLFNQLSLYIHFSRDFFHLNKLCINFQKAPRSSYLYRATHGTKFPKSIPHKIVFSKRMTALQTSRIVNINAK